MTEDDILGDDWDDLGPEERSRRLRLIAASVQPAPVESARSRDVLPFLVALLEERARFGKSKHGTTLKTNNGRPALIDALQECLDALQYLAQELMEREDEVARLRRQVVGEAQE